MKSKKIMFSVVTLLLLLVFILTGCSIGTKKASDDKSSGSREKTEYTDNESL